MHIATIDAISVNGKLTNGTSQPSHTWTSAEDQEVFRRVRGSFPVIVMGRNTYESVRPKPDAGHLRIVLTHNPEYFKDISIAGQLEFLSAEPAELVAVLESRGFDRMLLTGGQVNSAFWQAGLVDEAFITIEPLLFGSGQQLADIAGFGATLQLKSIKQLNKRGTIHLHYLVDKSHPPK